MWGAQPAPPRGTRFVSQISISSGAIASYGLPKRVEAVRACRTVSKKDMKWNDATPAMRVDPENYEVRADGELADIAPAQTKLPLARLYNLF
jgi:urease